MKFLSKDYERNSINQQKTIYLSPKMIFKESKSNNTKDQDVFTLLMILSV